MCCNDLLKIQKGGSMASYFEESVEIERKQIFEVTETVRYARKYFDDLSKSVNDTGENMRNLCDDCSNTSRSVRDAIDKIKNSYKALKSVLQPFATVFKGVSELTLDYSKQGKQLDDFVKKSGASLDVFQSLTNASKKYNGSAETTAQTLSNLNKSLEDISAGGSGNGLKDIAAKYDLDLSSVHSAPELLDLVAKKMKTLGSESEKLDLGQALGIDESIVNLMVDGLGSYKSHLAEADKYKLFEPEDIERSKQLDDSLESLKLGFDSIAQNISKLLLPVFVPLFKGIQNIVDYFVTNSDIVKNMFLELAAVVISGLIYITMHNWAAVSPFFVWLVAIAAIIALFVGLNVIAHEFISWIKGEDSIFSKWVGDFDSFKYYIKAGFKKLGKDIANVFIGIWHGITSIFGKIVGFVQDIISKVWSVIPDWLKTFFLNSSPVGIIAKGVIKAHDNIKKDGAHAAGLGYVPYDGYLAELHQGESVLNRSEANIWRDLMAGKNAINLTSNVPLASVPLGSISNAYTGGADIKSFTIGDITIQTAADDADGIANELAASIKMAFSGLDTGVRA